jgi:hypothetical protein
MGLSGHQWGVGMIEQQTADIGALVTSLESAGTQPNSEALAKMAKLLAGLFAVDLDEVAILKMVPKYKSLKFVIPEKFSPVGTIPLTSTSALAARTARERRPELVNNFHSSRHASVFEAVPLGRHPSETIHKIMSAPILDGNGKQVEGVVQISRKGRSSTDAGADFTPKDLRALAALSPILERFLKLCSVD